MAKGRNVIIISGILVAFLVGTITANPVVEAAGGWKPVAEVLQAAIIDLQTQIDNIELDFHQEAGDAPFNPLIEFVPGLNCDTDADPDCGSLQFVCDFEDPDAAPEVLASDECQQVGFSIFP